MHRLKTIFFLLLTIGAFQSCKDTKTGKIDLDKNYRIAFYNVENLFDTIDIPNKFDEDFTPTGKQVWNTERYAKKLADLDKVITAMAFPTLLGVCEIENEAVLKDLTAQSGMSKHNYGIVHYESPDKRGIDNALLYQKAYFKVESTDNIRIEFPASMEEGYTSRDIIYAKGIFLNQFPLHIFVNHWPSRRGGEKESQPKRVLVAQHLRNAVDKIFSKDPNANIVIIGDMNDEPDNDSILKTLKAGEIEDQIQTATLYNCMAKLKQQNNGTYNYRGNWNMLDNIITSSNLLSPTSKIHIQNPTIFQEDWMMFDSPKNGKTPNRTYGGPNYYGGISDHLPVYVDLRIRK
jgi:predicted extracellular nuclease